jgi:mono/diheme cytochrome c family protein
MTKEILKPFLIVLVVLMLVGCGSPETPTLDPAPLEEGEIQEEDPVEEAPTKEAEIKEETPTEEVPVAVEIDSEAIFVSNCARCHGGDRSGGRGPALLPERLTKDPAIYQTIISNGSGGMPSFNSKLTAGEISTLVEFILSEPQ